MKFNQRLKERLVPEWKTQYLNYKGLKKVIKQIRNESIKLAEAYSNIRKITGDEIPFDLGAIKEHRKFMDSLNGNVEVMTKFYLSQVEQFRKQFHGLVAASVKSDLLDNYAPQKRIYVTRLEKELMRIDENLRIERKEPAPTNEEELVLLPITKESAKDLPLAPGVSPLHTSWDRHQLKQNFCEFYRGLYLLENFCCLNKEGIEKILKKYDKNAGTRCRDRYMQDTVSKLPIYEYFNLKMLMAETEVFFEKVFADGDRNVAMNKLRVPKESVDPGTSLWVMGMMSGLILPILGGTMYFGSAFPGSAFPRLDSVLRVYRMLGVAILLVWFWGLAMYIWERTKINYTLIFGFDHRRTFRWQHMVGSAAIFSALWIYSLFFYMLSSTSRSLVGLSWMSQMPWQFFPLSLYLLMFLILIIYQIRSNFWLFRTFSNIVVAPFRYVAFKDFFLCNQITSLTIVLYDFEYVLCFWMYDAWNGTDYCTGPNKFIKPILSMIPSTWRFLQCLRRYYDSKDKRHLQNAGKYSCSWFVNTFSLLQANTNIRAFLYIWILCALFSATFSWYWDVVKDWDLLHKEHKYLRKKLTYPKNFYYWSIGSNLIYRLLWTLTISPATLTVTIGSFWFSTILAVCEVLRRSQWNLLRVENEHLSNSVKFKAVNVLIPAMKA